MSVFELHSAGNTEAQQKAGLAYLLAQSATGKAASGVLSGLVVSQTTTASGSVQVAAGGAVAQAAVLDGASLLVNDSTATVDVFTANPMGSLPRNDIIVFDAATLSVRVIVGTPNATPTDPTVPTSAVRLARLRNAANATTIPASAIDDLRTFTSLAGAPVLVRNSTERDALTKAAGTTVYRLDTGRFEVWDGAYWQVQARQPVKGKVTTPAAAIGALINIPVTFPAGRFASPPLVFVQASSTRLTSGYDPATVTTTGVTLQFTNWTSGAAAAAEATWRAEDA